MEIRLTASFWGKSGWTIDFKTYSFPPAPEDLGETRTITETRPSDPLAVTTLSYLETGTVMASGTFVVDRVGTSIQNEDGSYTATFEETVRVSDSTLVGTMGWGTDVPHIGFSFDGGIPLADVIGKSIQDLMTDGTVIVGSLKSDTIASLRSSETILAGGGNDKIDARGGADILDGGTGEDRLTGGGGADIFLFSAGYGRDVIVDFDARGQRHDTTDLSGLSAIDGFKDLKQHHLEQHGDNVWVRAGDDVLVIRDVEISDLRANDFTF